MKEGDVMLENNGREVSVGSSRWLLVGAGMVLLLLLGLIYAWSVFVLPIEREFSWNRSETSLAFTICMCFFCTGGLVAGFLSKRRPPRFIILLSSLFILVGFLFASRISSLAGLYLSYGCLVGFGVGLSYNTVISAVVRWFPDRVGLVSGLLLMGFGFGGMVLGTSCTAAIEKFGWRATFNWTGIVLFALIAAGAFIIKLPPEGMRFPSAVAGKKVSGAADVATGRMLASVSFWIFFVWTTLLTAAGLAAIGHAAPNAVDMGYAAQTAAIFSGLISVFNGGGRVASGSLFDRRGHKVTMLLVSCGFIVSGLLLIMALRFGGTVPLVLGYAFAGLSFGGIVPCNSAVIASFFGRANYPLNFSIVNMNILPASLLGPLCAGALKTATGSYLTTFVMMVVYGVTALVAAVLLKSPDA